MRVKFVSPLMPTLVEKPPEGEGWLRSSSTGIAPAPSGLLRHVVGRDEPTQRLQPRRLGREALGGKVSALVCQ